MTEHEFDNTQFGGKMKVRYKGEVYLISGVDFEERLIGYVPEGDLFNNDYTTSWARCENCELIT